MTPLPVVDPFSTAFRHDQPRSLSELRSAARLFWASSLEAYLVLSHELITEVLADPGTFADRREVDALGAPRRPDLKRGPAQI